MNRMISLRAHHRLCACSFQGLGYSGEFVDVFGRIIEDLGRPDTFVRVAHGVDDLCEVCPYRYGEQCAKGGVDALDLDKRVERFLNVASGELYAASELMARARRAADAGVSLLCEGCEWLSCGYCA